MHFWQGSILDVKGDTLCNMHAVLPHPPGLVIHEQQSELQSAKGHITLFLFPYYKGTIA
jgi:hypothetical protein